MAREFSNGAREDFISYGRTIFKIVSRSRLTQRDLQEHRSRFCRGSAEISRGNAAFPIEAPWISHLVHSLCRTYAPGDAVTPLPRTAFGGKQAASSGAGVSLPNFEIRCYDFVSRHLLSPSMGTCVLPSRCLRSHLTWGLRCGILLYLVWESMDP